MRILSITRICVAVALPSSVIVDSTVRADDGADDDGADDDGAGAGAGDVKQQDREPQLNMMHPQRLRLL